jgi:hypothetical protein
MHTPKRAKQQQPSSSSSSERARYLLLALAQRWPRQDVSTNNVMLDLLDRRAIGATAEAASQCLAQAIDDSARRGWSRADIDRLAARRPELNAAASAIVFDALRSVPVGMPSDGDGRDPRAAQVGWLRAVVVAIAFLQDLPPFPVFRQAQPSTGDPEQRRKLDKIRALLAKAEATSFDEEADAFTTKAQELIARYAISEAMLESGTDPHADVVALRLNVDDPYASAKALLLQAISDANNCATSWIEWIGVSMVFGREADTRAVELLYASLLLQANASMRRAGSVVDHAGRSRTRSFRQSFLVGFASRTKERLIEANRTAEAAATAEDGSAFLPVLAARKSAADDARDAASPVSGRRRVSTSSGDGYLAGRAAADTASHTLL